MRDGQLLILRRDTPRPPLPARPPNLAGSIPLEDLGLLVVDERETTYTHSLLDQLAENGCALVVCGRDHLPSGLFLPITRNTELLSRLDAQLSASRPTRKRLWSALVIAKIRAQAANLDHNPPVKSRLLAIARSVRSGDPINAEAHAARLYWPAMFDALPTLAPPFRRTPGDRAAKPPNNLLDYGYSVLRAAVARALVAAGLLPALGVRHHGRSNPFCLADDLLEPLRPLIDRRVRALAIDGRLTLDQPTKAELLLLLTSTVALDDRQGPLQVALTGYAASFARALESGPAELRIPLPVADEPPPLPPDDPELPQCT